jgi:hypothetical protein
MDEDLIKAYRLFLKDSIRKVIDFSRTDQNRGVAPPPKSLPGLRGHRGGGLRDRRL